MINTNKPIFDTGHIVSIQKMTSMTIIRVWIKGSAFEFASFKYKGRLKVNDHVRCKLRFSIIDDGLVIESLKKEIA